VSVDSADVIALVNRNEFACHVALIDLRVVVQSVKKLECLLFFKIRNVLGC